MIAMQTPTKCLIFKLLKPLASNAPTEACKPRTRNTHGDKGKSSEKLYSNKKSGILSIVNML